MQRDNGSWPQVCDIHAYLAMLFCMFHPLISFLLCYSILCICVYLWYADSLPLGQYQEQLSSLYTDEESVLPIIAMHHKPTKETVPSSTSKLLDSEPLPA